MKTKSIMLLLLPAVIWGLAGPAGAQRLERVTPAQDALLARHERSEREFLKLEIGDIISYFHLRRIGDAIVELDFIRYQFDRDTHELFDRTVRWREDLPNTVDPLVTREQAESMASGDVQLPELYFISPESEVYKLDPVPVDPCWVVRSEVDGGLEILVIDAMTGERLGYGIPPPAPTGYSLSGPSPRNEFVCSCPSGPSLRSLFEAKTSRYCPDSITVPAGNCHLVKSSSSSVRYQPSMSTDATSGLRISIQSSKSPSSSASVVALIA